MNRYTFAKDGKSIILVPLSPKYVYEDKLKFKRESEVKGVKIQIRPMRKKYESHKERKMIYLTKKVKEIILDKSEGKYEKRRKKRLERKECGKIKKYISFYANKSEIKSDFYSNKPIIVL